MMTRHQPIDDLAAGAERPMRPLLVLPHEARVAHHVSSEYGREAALHATSSLTSEISEFQWKNLCAERILGMSPHGY